MRLTARGASEVFKVGTSGDKKNGLIAFDTVLFNGIDERCIDRIV